MTSNRAAEIKLDIDDVNNLLALAKRQRSKDVLSLEIRRLESQLSNIMEQDKMDIDTPANKPASTNSSAQSYNVKLSNYAWDQSDNFIKLYITLKNIQTLPKESVICNFSERSLDLRVTGLENKNYHLLINNLCEKIDTSKSYFKQKTDLLIVFLAKQSKKTWTCVTGVEKQIKDAKTAIPSTSEEEADPGASLMNLMKQMYQSGDDEMKKTIAKAWTQTQEKQSTGGIDSPML